MEDQGIAKSEKRRPASLYLFSLSPRYAYFPGWLAILPALPGSRTDARICPDRPEYRERPGKNRVYNAGCNEEASTLLVPGYIPWNSIYPCAFTKMCPDNCMQNMILTHPFCSGGMRRAIRGQAIY